MMQGKIEGNFMLDIASGSWYDECMTNQPHPRQTAMIECFADYIATIDDNDDADLITLDDIANLAPDFLLTNLDGDEPTKRARALQLNFNFDDCEVDLIAFFNDPGRTDDISTLMISTDLAPYIAYHPTT